MGGADMVQCGIVSSGVVHNSLGWIFGKDLFSSIEGVALFNYENLKLFGIINSTVHHNILYTVRRF